MPGSTVTMNKIGCMWTSGSRHTAPYLCETFFGRGHTLKTPYCKYLLLLDILEVMLNFLKLVGFCEMRPSPIAVSLSS